MHTVYIIVDCNGEMSLHPYKTREQLETLAQEWDADWPETAPHILKVFREVEAT